MHLRGKKKNELTNSQEPRNRRKLPTSESRLTRERGGRRLRMLVSIMSLRDMLRVVDGID